jgi:membrane associated rhomboid family serine protease
MLQSRGSSSRDDGAAADRAVEYFADHPYLQVPAGALPELDPETVDLGHQAARALEPPDDETMAGEQKQLDALIAAARAAPSEDPMQRYGYVPARHNWLGLLTSPFVHAGWMHLAGNMWFLFFCGMTLEDRWGRIVFPLFYLSAGAVAALVHGAFMPHDTAPLVGASGAIAGCMGAFAVAFARTRVRFAWLLAVRPRIFTAPAYVVLPFWAVFEAAWGFIFPADGTAHWAHVGGFAFGVVVGLVLHRTGLDRRLDDAVEVAAVLEGDPRIEEAKLLLRRGRGPEALAMLEGLTIERPDSAVVQEAMAEVARATGDDARAQKATQRAERLRASQR